MSKPATEAKICDGGSVMVPRPAQYLLRFDDLCPTVAHTRWQRFLPLIAEFGIRPILAVVPDNQDYELKHEEPDPEFWARMRSMEAAGATIALHGYRHLCNSKGKSLVPLHRHSEFAGVPKEIQRQWIQEGLSILRGHGLNPRLWVAPRHGFDRGTLQALRGEGISLLSDGLARVPFTRGGLTWIPQQLWEPVDKSKGLWTICVHTNTARGSLVDQLLAFLRRHGAQFTSVDRVLAELKPTKLGPAERLYEAFALWRVQAARTRKRAGRRSRR
jgi:predicted deacetylase